MSAFTYGILLFDRVEELDFSGPLNVFSYAGWGSEGHRVATIGERVDTLTCGNGLRVIPEYSFETAPALDLLLVPGGRGTEAASGNPRILDWIRYSSEPCRWITSVYTGAFLLHAAGLAKGRPITTHWGAIDSLREAGAENVVANARYVHDDRLVTSAGVSAGIDMALWLVGQIYSVDHARHVQRMLDYNPQPPYPLAS